MQILIQMLGYREMHIARALGSQYKFPPPPPSQVDILESHLYNAHAVYIILP